MQKARYFIALTCAGVSAACGTEVAVAVKPAGLVDAGPPGIPDKPPVCMSTKLIDRLSYGTISLSEGVRYKRAGVFYSFPQDDRIAFSTTNSGASMVAWLNNAGTHVHVTQLTPEFRALDDAVMEGTELGGLVALDDGFAVLTRRLDLGAPVGDGMTPTQATYLVRWKDGHQLFAVPLTGTKSITNAPENEKRDFPLSIPNLALSGRLAFNGSQYGAYFGVRGGVGDRYEGVNSDKLVQVDDTGQYVSGWRTACKQNLGMRLVPEMNSFVAFCMSDGSAGTAGLYVVDDLRNMRRLTMQSTVSARGYLGSYLGSAVKMTDGYIVAWASRGVYNGNEFSPAYDSHEPAVAVVDKDLNLAAKPEWPFLPATLPDGGVSSGPIRDALNVHAAAYGDRVLYVWETLDSPQYRSNGGNGGYSTGTYGGTHFRLVDAQGNTASGEEFLLRAIAPNTPDDIVQFPNHDLGWAYVPEERNFQAPVTAPAVPNQPAVSEIQFVRLQYCIP